MTASIADPYYFRKSDDKLFQILLNLRELSRNPNVRHREQSALLESRLKLLRRQAISHQIKRLRKLGLEISEISKLTGIDYHIVYGVLILRPTKHDRARVN